MDIKERIEELEYYVTPIGDNTLIIYKHGNFITRLFRYDKRSGWMEGLAYIKEDKFIERLKHEK